MLCCSKRTQRINAANAKIFEMRAASPGESELEYEDIESSEMDNDNNDDIEYYKNKINSKQEKLKLKLKSKNLSSKKRRKLNSKLQQHKMNDVETVEDDSSDLDETEMKANGDESIFSDDTDDGMSMARMREEYYKSQTLTKKFTDLLDDIRDILKNKQKEVQHKFTKKKQMIVVPMAMPQSQPQSQSLSHTVKLKGNESEDNIENIENKQQEQEDVAQHSVDSECDEKVREDD